MNIDFGKKNMFKYVIVQTYLKQNLFLPSYTLSNLLITIVRLLQLGTQ